jgi:hypothetical protein
MKHKFNGDRDYSLAEIAALVKDCRASGLGILEFARQHGLPPGRLHYWIYQKCRPRPPVTARPAATLPGFQEIKLAALLPGAEPWAAEVSLASGLRVRFSPAATPGWIGSVLEALQRPC